MIKTILEYVAGYGLGLLATYAAIVSIRLRAPSHVYILMYFASLAASLALLVGGYAIGAGALTATGFPQGTLGLVMLNAFKAFADLETDFKVIAALASVVIVPQLVAYLFSGLAGCATNVRFVDAALNFLAWSLAKSLVVTTGVFYATAALQIYSGWSDWLASNAELRSTWPAPRS